MRGLLYCKCAKPYLIHKNIIESPLYYYNKEKKKNEDYVISNDERYKYYSKNGKIIGEVEYELKKVDIDQSNYRELQDLMKDSNKSLEEILKCLNNKNIGQALYVNNIDLFIEEKELSEICSHKRDNWLKVIVEKEVYDPKTSKKVFKRGETNEENSKLMISLSSQEIQELLLGKTKVILKNKV